MIIQANLLQQADIEAIVDLLGRLADPANSPEVFARKRQVAEGLVALVDADVFIWAIGVANSTVAGDGGITNLMDGGWRDEAERNAFFHFLLHSELGRVSTTELTTHVFQGTSHTLLRQDRFDDPSWLQISQEYQQLGFANFLLSIYPLGDQGSYSCLALHRRQGKPNYSERDRALVHLVFQNIAWLHRYGAAPETGKTAVELSPREREVLLLLLRGHSQKMIAAALGIGHHTVGDYLKQIYRRFHVNSRGELLGRFISGEGIVA